MADKTNILCAIRGHAPGSQQSTNRGIDFARCRRCGGDLVRKGGAWQAVPRGYRVVWRPRACAAPDTSGDSVVTVLVCDDDPLIRDLLAHRLVQRGYRVELARNGAEGLARVAERRPNAIVLNAMMPRIDGFEVLRQLREDEETRQIPVIFLTARRLERDVLDALRLGADDFINKPFIPEELLSRLARLIAARGVRARSAPGAGPGGAVR